MFVHINLSVKKNECIVVMIIINQSKVLKNLLEDISNSFPSFSSK